MLFLQPTLSVFEAVTLDGETPRDTRSGSWSSTKGARKSTLLAGSKFIRTKGVPEALLGQAQLLGSESKL